jgi:lysozyme
MQTTGATHLSEKGAKIIRGYEGLVLQPYRDSAGIPTTGFGSTRWENGKPVTMNDMPITHDRAMQLFNFEAQAKAYVLAQALQHYSVVLNQNQFDALVSFSYNVGIAGLLASTLFRLIKKDPNDPEIKAAFLMWVKITLPGTKKKVVSNGLVQRREKEIELYFSK